MSFCKHTNATQTRRTMAKPLVLREDFCGTAMLSHEWVARDVERTAWGVDLDADVLAWADAHHRQGATSSLYLGQPLMTS